MTRPIFSITADGADITALIDDRLLSLRVIDEQGWSADRMDLELDDRDNLIEFPDTDAQLDVALGTALTGLVDLGSYAVDEVAGSGPERKLTIRAKAADMKGQIRAPQSRAWEDVTLKDIAAKIAAEAGLEPVVGESIAQVHYPYVAQTAESNLHFLTRLAKNLDGTAKASTKRLIVMRRGEGTTAAGDALEPVSLAVTAMTDWRWKLSEREKVATVEAEWSAVDAAETRKITVGSGEPKKKLRHVFASESEARSAAEAELSLSERAAFSLTASLAGFEPGLFALCLADLTGLHPELDGEWTVTKVTHRLRESLTTEFEAIRGRPE